MAIDFQIAFPQESINLNQVRLISANPRLIEVHGDDFTSVDEVVINGIPADDVVVVTAKKLVAQVPDVFKNMSLVTVSVLSKRLTVTPRSLIRFRIGKSPGKVRGIQRLVQLFLKILFTTPGKDIFSPRFGGGVLKFLGMTFGIDQGGEIVSDFIIAVNNTARQIVAIQGRDPSLPRDERLLSAKVLRAGYNRNEGALAVAIEITSQAGRAALANLEL